MEQRLSKMTHYELQQEIARLNELAKKAEQKGMVSEFAVHERKKVIAQSYMLDRSNYVPGRRYTIAGEGGESFLISYLNGVFAWGYRTGEKELAALPLALLNENEEE